ncbi:hypothetical protein OOT55_14890 [Marinimicrobium sp. C6131]|uniref:hypothetical protein n=1 Tax=Marinimicrobium sp. C6131 TaxID=3022676 RepID=UPI00223D93ED|nr:hypothetical protein [Marinimicrobium sp. C6131]UZJ43931.1 hypothetical protein OOT55_14890 [Marinimicrobium sp. C6131]
MASQYPLDDNDVDDVLEDEDSADDEVLDESEVELSYSGKSEGYEDFSVAARQRLRDELARQVEAFLARGGHISEIPSTLNNTRPKKPVSDYGDRMM